MKALLAQITMLAKLAWIGVLIPTIALGCESGDDARRCQDEIAQLVTYRAKAIETAFGDLSTTLPAKLSIRFVKMKDPENAKLVEGVRYDPEQRVLLVGHTAIRSKTPNPLQDASRYWPYYQNKAVHLEYPIVETIDNVLWGALLQDSARRNGLTWPHKDCASPDIGKRLPCEMLLTAVTGRVKMRRDIIFNENRLDRIWPENFQAFLKRVWHRDELEYRDVQRFGGILLIKPLIGEFGVPRVLAYVAQTPFSIDEDNLRASALRYQERAREVLRLSSADAQGHVSRDRSRPERSLEASVHIPVQPVDLTPQDR